MARPAFELAGVFRQYGAAYRAGAPAAAAAVAGDARYRSVPHLRARRPMSKNAASAITRAFPTTPAATGTVRNVKTRSGPNGSPTGSRELLPVEYFHVVFTIPEEIGPHRFLQTKRRSTASSSRRLRRTAAHHRPATRSTSARRSVFFAILHTWGQNLQHHPHIHCVVPGGGLAPGYETLDRLQARLLPARARALTPVPPPLAGSSGRRLLSKEAAVLRRNGAACRMLSPFTP